MAHANGELDNKTQQDGSQARMADKKAVLGLGMYLIIIGALAALKWAPVPFAFASLSGAAFAFAAVFLYRRDFVRAGCFNLSVALLLLAGMEFYFATKTDLDRTEYEDGYHRLHDVLGYAPLQSEQFFQVRCEIRELGLFASFGSCTLGNGTCVRDLFDQLRGNAGCAVERASRLTEIGLRNMVVLG